MPVTQWLIIFRAGLGPAAAQAMGQRHRAEYLDMECCFVTLMLRVCDLPACMCCATEGCTCLKGNVNSPWKGSSSIIN